MINLVADALLPPVGLAAAAFLLVAFGGRRCRRLAIATLVVVLLLGLPPVGTALLNSLAPPAPAPGPEPGAIVILSADGIRVSGPTDLEPGILTLDRMRAGAALQRRTSLPILVSGGRFLNAQTTLAGMMAASLREDFRVPVRWEEDRSTDTWQNGQFSAAILRESGISRVYLVTHAWHMRRSLLAFRAAGLDPVPASVRPPYQPPLVLRQLVPSAAAWLNSYYALHEMVGLAFYSLRH